MNTRLSSGTEKVKQRRREDGHRSHKTDPEKRELTLDSPTTKRTVGCSSIRSEWQYFCLFWRKRGDACRFSCEYIRTPQDRDAGCLWTPSREGSMRTGLTDLFTTFSKSFDRHQFAPRQLPNMMKQLLLLLLVLNCVYFSSGFLFEPDPDNHREICYHTDGLGCFNNNAPFHTAERPMNYLPGDLSLIGTRFILYTRDAWNSSVEEILTISDPSSTNSSHFSAARPTKVIIHGFTHSAQEDWVQAMVRELLQHDDLNVIAVDWSKGAGIPYGQAASNGRVVGAQVAQLIDHLEANLNHSARDVHLIGHGLGAHVAGYAGERMVELGRITGLDPSSPYFEHTPPQVRLDPSDASFVDVIHTDGSSLTGLGMGSSQAMGHVDFYPNGGVRQPGCDSGLLGTLTHTLWNAASIGFYAAKGAAACSHLRATDLFTESINTDCPFTAYPCASGSLFSKGRCLACSGHGCGRLGYHADSMHGRGSLYVGTQDSATFCSYHYQVNLTSENSVDGIASVLLYGSKGRTESMHMTQRNEILNSGSITSHLMTTRHDVGWVTAIGVRFQKSSTPIVHLLYKEDWTLRSATTYAGETQSRYVFCAGGKTLHGDTQAIFQLAGNC